MIDLTQRAMSVLFLDQLVGFEVDSEEESRPMSHFIHLILLVCLTSHQLWGKMRHLTTF